MDKQQFKTIISSKHRLFDLHIKETFEYKDLIFLFVKRDFVASYKQTILGPLWAIIQPLLTTIIFTVVFGNLAGLTTSDSKSSLAIPAFLFYMAGNICWSYFSSSVTKISNTFINNRRVMEKVYYPRLATPVASSFSNLISFGIQLALFLILWIFYLIKGNAGIKITPYILLVPVTILQLMILSVGIGIIVSSLTTKYRDLVLLVAFGLELWRYASPIAYGLQLIPEKWLYLYMLNPVSEIVTTFRFAFFGDGFFDITYFVISWIMTIVIFFIGILLFSKIEKNFMDTI